MVLKIVMIVVSLFLWGCTEPFLVPSLSINDIQKLRDGGYCKDQWGRELGDMACGQQHENLIKDHYQSR